MYLLTFLEEKKLIKIENLKKSKYLKKSQNILKIIP